MQCCICDVEIKMRLGIINLPVGRYPILTSFIHVEPSMHDRWFKQRCVSDVTFSKMSCGLCSNTNDKKVGGTKLSVFGNSRRFRTP